MHLCSTQKCNRRLRDHKSAVDPQHLPRHERRVNEIRHRLRDILRPAQLFNRGLLAKLFHHLRRNVCAHVGLDHARANRVDANAARPQFLRQRLRERQNRALCR